MIATKEAECAVVLTGPQETSRKETSILFAPKLTSQDFFLFSTSPLMLQILPEILQLLLETPCKTKNNTGW